jgi:hypothetical protein
MKNQINIITKTLLFILIVCVVLAGCDSGSNRYAADTYETYQTGLPEPTPETTPQTEPLPDEVSEPEGLSIGEQLGIYYRFNDAVFGIFSDEKEAFLGSGFIIDETGIAITAAHVLTQSVEPWAKLADDSWAEIAGVYVYDELSDIAVIQLTSRDEPYPYLEIENRDNVGIDDIVYVIGAPQGSHGFFSYGVINKMEFTSYAGDLESNTIRITASIWRGNSGCPIVNENGKAVGIASASTWGLDGVNLMNIAVNATNLDIEAIKELRLYTLNMAQIIYNGRNDEAILEMMEFWDIVDTILPLFLGD